MLRLPPPGKRTSTRSGQGRPRSSYKAPWAAAAAANLPRGSETILLVEDNPDDEALTLLRSAEFDPRHEVLLASAEARPVTPPTGGAESINIRSYAAEKVTLDVTAPAAGYLVLTDAWYPGWQVRVDGTPATLERANVMFRAV